MAIHLKGGPGSYRPFNDMPSLTVNFDKFAPGQTFHGLKKIHLNSSVQDGTYLSEKICRELFETAGVPAPRAGNALVRLNDRDMGLYVIIEGVNKQFLKRYFKDTKGNIYDGHSQTDVTDDLPTNDGDAPNDKSRLKALATAANQRNLERRLASLEKTLDLDRFLSFVAMETMLWHWDGYTIGRNNFRIFHDRDKDRMVFLPHGMDQVLSKASGPIFPPTSGLVARSVLEIPEARRRYRERFTQLATNVFRTDAVVSRVHEVAEKIQTVLMETNPEAADLHRRRVASFINRVQRRAKSLHNQLTPTLSLELATGPLTDWESRVDLGDATLSQEQAPNGKMSLHITTGSGCTASWRASRILPAGQYTLEARIKTQGVELDPNDPRAGAGLRISGHRVGQKNHGDMDWTLVTFDFEVTEEQSDIELVCELRANHGSIWFDLNSLSIKQR